MANIVQEEFKAPRFTQEGGTGRMCQYIDASKAGVFGGATATEPNGSTLGGYRLNASSEELYFHASVCNNWDAASDLKFVVYWEVNIDNSGGNVGDTVDIRCRTYIKGEGDITPKLQTLEESTVVGQSAQYKQFKTIFTIDYDDGTNPVDVGDVICFFVNLETDTSEIDDIIINMCRFSYKVAKLLPEP
jgi:hypothetical protein